MNYDVLNRSAKDNGLRLVDIYEKAGLHRTTYWRHARGKSSPKPGTAYILRRIIRDLSTGTSWKDYWREDLKQQFVRLRKRRRLTQGDVEDLLGVTQALVGKYEAKMRTPSAFLLCCWADVLSGTLRLVPVEAIPEVDRLLEAYYGKTPT